MSQRRRHAAILRQVRAWHRYTGIALFLFFFVMAITGLLLGWKKHSGKIIMPPTQKGQTETMSEWLPLEELTSLAHAALLKDRGIHSRLDRIDVRPSKGLMKFLFTDANLEVQLDTKTGEILSIGRRHADFIETLHDGSVIDDLFHLPNGIFKVFYNTVMGIALIIFTVTGFWLWYGPKRMRRNRK